MIYLFTIQYVVVTVMTTYVNIYTASNLSNITSELHIVIIASYGQSGSTTNLKCGLTSASLCVKKV